MRRGTACAVFMAVLAVSCGDGGNKAPTTPPAVAPPSRPPPTSIAPRHRAKVAVFSVPTQPGGYVEGDWIRFVAEFEPRIEMRSSTRLAIQIGEEIRHADLSPWIARRVSGHDRSHQHRFDYLVQADDLDEDGISVAADAFDFPGMEVDIYSVAPTESGDAIEPGKDLDAHVVIGEPLPRTCTDERRLALDFHDAVLPREWDGTPFQFYFSRVGLPKHDEVEAELALRVIQRLSERIEDQLGYPIIEVAGWMDDERVRFSNSCEWRMPGQIVGMVVVESSPEYVGPGARARPRCAIWAAMPSLHINPDEGHSVGTVAHETFHNLGFTHSFTDWRNPGTPGEGVPMSVRLNGTYVDGVDLGVSYADVDALRCIFPQGQ